MNHSSAPCIASSVVKVLRYHKVVACRLPGCFTIPLQNEMRKMSTFLFRNIYIIYLDYFVKMDVLIKHSIQSSGLFKVLYMLLPGRPVQSNTIAAINSRRQFATVSMNEVTTASCATLKYNLNYCFKLCCHFIDVSVMILISTVQNTKRVDGEPIVTRTNLGHTWLRVCHKLVGCGRHHRRKGHRGQTEGGVTEGRLKEVSPRAD